MKGLLVFIGVISFIVSGIMAYHGYSIYSVATRISEQALGMQYVTYSGIMLLVGVLGLKAGCSDDETHRLLVKIFNK